MGLMVRVSMALLSAVLMGSPIIGLGRLVRFNCSTAGVRSTAARACGCLLPIGSHRCGDPSLCRCAWWRTAFVPWAAAGRAQRQHPGPRPLQPWRPHSGHNSGGGSIRFYDRSGMPPDPPKSVER